MDAVAGAGVSYPSDLRPSPSVPGTRRRSWGGSPSARGDRRGGARARLGAAVSMPKTPTRSARCTSLRPWRRRRGVPLTRPNRARPGRWRSTCCRWASSPVDSRACRWWTFVSVYGGPCPDLGSATRRTASPSERFRAADHRSGRRTRRESLSSWLRRPHDRLAARVRIPATRRAGGAERPPPGPASAGDAGQVGLQQRVPAVRNRGEMAHAVGDRRPANQCLRRHPRTSAVEVVHKVAGDRPVEAKLARRDAAGRHGCRR